MNSRLRFFLYLVGIVLSGGVFAQTGAGTLKGKVTDAGTGETLPFANVVVMSGGTQVGGGATDFDGNFTIKPIPPGSYDVKCVFVGYNAKVVSGVVVRGDKITFQDFALSSGVNLDEVIVVDYVEPLINKDGGASGGTVSRGDIDKMAARSATSVASTVGGVSAAGQTGNDEGEISLRGARADNTYFYIDGIKVRGTSNLPKSAIEEVSVITGGVPANYGDATGGIISITTRGASSEYFGGVDLLTSGFKAGDDIIGLDAFGRTQFEGYLSGPILFKKDEEGNKTDPLLGFFVSANVRKFEDTRPSAIGHWYLKEDVQERLDANPVFFEENADGSYSQQLTASYFTKDDFENVKAAKNSDEFAGSLSAKFDLNLNKNSVFTVGGTADFRNTNDFRNYSYTQTTSIANIAARGRLNAPLNWQDNSTTDRFSWRGFARYTQRFNSTEDSKVKNAYYTISVDYSKDVVTTQDRNHEDNFFNYGHVGQFDVERRLTFNNANLEQTGIETYYNGFTSGTANPILSQVNVGAFNAAQLAGDTLTADNINITGLGNGAILDRPYGFFVNVGTPANFYRDANNSQFRLTTSGTADIGDHAITVGVEYEQRVDRGFDMTPVGLWERARQLSNDHIDVISDEVFYSGYYSEVGDFVELFLPQVNASGQSAFDRNLRIKLGLDPEGDNFNFTNPAEYEAWIEENFLDVESLDPSFLSLDMFSANDLLRNGANLVDYYGYDHTGKILSGQPSLDDYFNDRDDQGYRTYAIDAFRPVYMAGYVMDKFAFDDIIFNVGVRVDRFDANQSVLKDEYIVRDFHTVGNVPTDAPLELIEDLRDNRPSNVDDDFVLYVDDLDAPTQVKGFRDGDVWYNAQGEFVDDPRQINVGVDAFPYLKDGSRELTTGAFKDYDPQINVMPRVAFSFPVSDEAVFFAHYDILTQRPERGVRLQLTNYDFIQTQSNVINNPALKPTKTIDYELGFQQVLTRSSSLKISAFYRDMRDMIQIRQLAGAYPEQYLTYRNIDFGTVKGLTMAYDLRRTGNTRINANYTLQFADGTGSNSRSGFNLANSGQPNLQNISPLNFDQRHAINVTLDYRYGDGKDYNGPVWFGKQVLSNTGLNLIANLGSGTPYSNTKRAVNVLDGRTSGGLAGTLNGARLPSLFTLNAQLDKNIELKFGKDEEKQKTANMNIYLLINNLLNTKNIVQVYPYTGSAEDDGFLVTSEGQRAINDAPSSQSYADLYDIRLQNPYNYGRARTIQIGVKLDF